MGVLQTGRQFSSRARAAADGAAKLAGTVASRVWQDRGPILGILQAGVGIGASVATGGVAGAVGLLAAGVLGVDSASSLLRSSLSAVSGGPRDPINNKRKTRATKKRNREEPGEGAAGAGALTDANANTNKGNDPKLSGDALSRMSKLAKIG